VADRRDGIALQLMPRVVPVNARTLPASLSTLSVAWRAPAVSAAST
jgi:hypothetical protein